MLGQSLPISINDSPIASQNSFDQLETNFASLSLSPDKSILALYDKKRSSSESSSQKLIKLKSEFKVESHKGYLTEETREKYKVTCNDTFFCDADGKLLEGAYIYVLLPNYQLCCAPITEHLQHSYFNAGHGVRGAGVVYMSCGRLITMSNESGHYTPTHEEMQDAIAWFYQQVKGHRFLFEDHSAQDKALEFNGIKYYSISALSEDPDSYVKQQLSNCNLLNTLAQLRKNELQYYVDNYFNANNEGADSDENYDSDDSTIYFTEFNPKELIIPEEGADIFEYPDLLKLTCLQNIHKKIFSRYGCHLKPSLITMK